MANIAVQRIKREFKEVLKSEEVRNELPDTPISAQGGRALPSATLAAPARLAAAAFLPMGKRRSPLLLPPPFPPLPGPWDRRSRGRAGRPTGRPGKEQGLGGRCRSTRRGHVSARGSPEAAATSGSGTVRWGRKEQAEKTREVGWGKGKGSN